MNEEVEKIQQKKQLRKQMRQIRDRISYREEKSKQIVARFMELSEVKEATIIYCYVSFRSEVDTMPLLKALWECGKCVAVPRVDTPVGKKRQEMNFYKIHSTSDLELGYYGILEPKQQCELAQKADIIVMPGLAFDKQGHRLGYGGGFYDSYLEHVTEGKKIALAFTEQMIEKVPVEEQDVIVDKIVTDK